MLPDSFTNPTVIVVTGPTASGKTSLALTLAQKYDTSIVSVDSRQCYRELNIGVAKPTCEELDLVHHYFIIFLFTFYLNLLIYYKNSALKHKD